MLALLAILVIIQFFRIDKSNPQANAEEDFISMMNPPADVAGIIKGACYDCHSLETKPPWHTNVAPVSWWIGHHIEEARGHLNFSTWNTYDTERESTQSGRVR